MIFFLPATARHFEQVRAFCVPNCYSYLSSDFVFSNYDAVFSAFFSIFKIMIPRSLMWKCLEVKTAEKIVIPSANLSFVCYIWLLYRLPIFIIIIFFSIKMEYSFVLFVAWKYGSSCHVTHVGIRWGIRGLFHFQPTNAAI